MRHLIVLFCCFGVLTACGVDSEEDSARVRIIVPAAPDISQPIEVVTGEVTPLTNAATEKVQALQDVIERDSLSRLVRQARAEPTFISNFAGESHRVHWDLLRRTGFDPLRQLRQLLDGPYGTREVGDELWYIWPDLAALPPEALTPERLSFADRARLKALIGEVGMARVRAGQGYPGVRTAISESGRWLYFVHESEDEVRGETP